MSCNPYDLPMEKKCGSMYIGARYVPQMEGKWDNTREYEPLSIVVDGSNNSYTSKIYVPIGVELTDTMYWVQTGNFEGALKDVDERYKKEIARLDSEILVVNNNLATMQSAITQNTNSISATNINVEVNRLALETLDKKVKTLEDKHDNLVLEYEEFKKTTNEELLNLDNKITTINDLIKAMQASIDVISSDLDTLKNRVKVVEDGLLELSGKHETLQNSFEQYKDVTVPNILKDYAKHQPVATGTITGEGDLLLGVNVTGIYFTAITLTDANTGKFIAIVEAYNSVGVGVVETEQRDFKSDSSITVAFQMDSTNLAVHVKDTLNRKLSFRGVTVRR